MSIKVGCISHDMRILGRIVGVRSTEQSAGIIVGAFDPNIIIFKIILFIFCIKFFKILLIYFRKKL